MNDSLPRIRQLPEQVINQIAAGEVVERPASVVKELVENSLDAGARHIDILIEQGGARSIRVSDDGHGLTAADLALALGRHCTSKLRELDDLQNMRSMGFRGEALPSIAAVSRLRMSSRAAGAEVGWAVESAGDGRVSEPAPCARTPGTMVEVQALFERVPARRKFLRSERTEFHHIQQFVQRIALARPDVSLELRHNGRLALRTGQGEDEEAWRLRLRRICGGAFLDQALPVNVVSEGMHVQGHVAPATAARNQSDLQFFSINGRVIRDPLILRAVRRAYGESLGSDRHPAWVLSMRLPPASFDVNVHPAKTEVRFHEPRRVHDFLMGAVRQALAGEAQVSPGAQAGASTPTFTAAMPGRGDAPGVRQRRGDWSLYRPASPLPVRPAAEAPTELRVLARPAGTWAIVARGDSVWLVGVAGLVADRLAGLEDPAAAARRPLLFPERLRLEAVAAERLQALGLEVDQQGPTDWVLRSLPACLGEVDTTRLAAGLAADHGSHRAVIAALASALAEASLARLVGGALAAARRPAWLLAMDAAQLQRWLPGAGH